MENNFDLDKINNERIINSKKRVAHALQIIRNSINVFELAELRKKQPGGRPGVNRESESKKISIAVSLLDTAAEDIKFACDHFDWDDSVRLQIDDAVIDLGAFMSEIEYEGNESKEDDGVEFNLKDASAKLSKALASLVHWFDDTVRVEDV